jgi:hypothetical protein
MLRPKPPQGRLGRSPEEVAQSAAKVRGTSSKTPSFKNLSYEVANITLVFNMAEPDAGQDGPSLAELAFAANAQEELDEAGAEAPSASEKKSSQCVSYIQFFLAAIVCM